MPRISIDNYDTVASWNGSQDLFVVEQPDGTKVATPAMVKQFIEAGDFEATGEVKDGHGNTLAEINEQIEDITNKADIQEITVASPGSGTNIQKATNVITAVLNNITLKRPYTSVNVKYDGIYRGQMNISAVSGSFSYSIGTYMSYYTDEVYKFINSNGNITVTRMIDDNLISDRAIIVKANTSDTKTFTIPKSIWNDKGLIGTNHTALFCSGYNGRASAGILATNSQSVSVIKLGDNNVTASISGNNIVITFTDTVYAQLYLILFN